MSDIKRYFLHALTPVHSGTGQGVGVIDLPIAREKATGWPVLPGSGVKGVLRDAVESEYKDFADKAFGKKGGGDEGMTTGQVVLTDAHILCFPVQSFFGTFAYVTCPLAITRFNRLNRADALNESAAVGKCEVLLCENSALNTGADSTKVYLEDLDLTVTVENSADKIGDFLGNQVFDTADEQKSFKECFAIISDEMFSFLCETATEVSARIKLNDDSKTVDSKSGGLWYEEAVPAEAIFSGIMMLAGHVKNLNGEIVTLDGLNEKLANKTIQIGGKSSVGRGLCRLAVK